MTKQKHEAVSLSNILCTYIVFKYIYFTGANNYKVQSNRESSFVYINSSGSTTQTIYNY